MINKNALNGVLVKLISLELDSMKSNVMVDQQIPKDQAICDCIYGVLLDEKLALTGNEILDALAVCVRTHLGHMSDPWGYAKSMNCPLFERMLKMGRCRASCSSKRNKDGTPNPSYNKCVVNCLNKVN